MTSRTTTRLAVLLAVSGGLAALAGAPVRAQTTPSSSAPTTQPGSTTSVSTSVPTTPSIAQTPVEPPLGPVQPLALAFDAQAGTITIVNPCGTGGDDADPQQVTYDLFLVPEQGSRTQLASKQSPYATVPAGQSKTYTIPEPLPEGTYEVLLQCAALPITIDVPRDQFAATIEWEGRAAPTPAPAAPVGGSSTYTG